MNGDTLEVIAACQAAFVGGMALVIFIWYFAIPHTDRVLRAHVVTISCSYLLLTLGTVITIFQHVYRELHVWHFAVMPAYLLGDISLLIMLRHVSLKKKKLKQNQNGQRK